MGDHFHIDDNEDFEFSSDFKISARLKLASDAEYYNIICARYYYDSYNNRAYGYILRLDDERARFTIYDGDATPINVMTTGRIDTYDEYWEVTCYYYDASNFIRIVLTNPDSYSDVVDVDCYSDPSPIPGDNVLFHVGQNSDTNGGYQPFDGKICELIIFD